MTRKEQLALLQLMVEQAQRETGGWPQRLLDMLHRTGFALYLMPVSIDDEKIDALAEDHEFMGGGVDD